MAERFSYYLCEELIFIVLSYLPVISLLRCKSVCKTWLSIISNQQFVQSHLAISKTKQASVLKVYYNRSGYSIDTPEESVKLDLPFKLKGNSRLIRTCNGLVCVSDIYCQDISIWNPCTRQFKMLLPPNKVGHLPAFLGFGFDSVANDYEILRVTLYKSELCGVLGFGFLYSANADSWKEIQVPQSKEPLWLGICTRMFKNGLNAVNAPCINGVLYLEDFDRLLWFDLHTEVFGEIGVLRFPSCVQVQHKQKSNVFDYEGSVAVIVLSVGDDDSVLSLWTLDDVCGGSCVD